MDEARRLFADARAAESRSGEHLRRFVAAGHLPADAGSLIEALEA